MESAKLYEVAFAATEDPELDAETIALEEKPLALDAILDVSRRYKVRARLIENGQVIGEFVPADERPSSTMASLRLTGKRDARPSSS